MTVRRWNRSSSTRDRSAISPALIASARSDVSDLADELIATDYHLPFGSDEAAMATTAGNEEGSQRGTPYRIDQL